VGECSFWYRPTRVVPDQRPLNGRCFWYRLSQVVLGKGPLKVCVCGVTTAVQASTVELKHRVQSNICHSLAASITSTLPGFQLTTVDFADSSPDSARWNSFVRHLLVKNGFSSKCCSKRYTHHTSHAKTTDNNSTEPHNRQQNTPELYEGRSKSFATSYLG